MGNGSKIKADFKPYEGEQNYIFVSYSHCDKDAVFPIIERLNAEGFRIWYDEGIEWGSEWPQSIADHVKTCSALVLFVSKNSLKSKNCREEFQFVHKRESNDILAIYLEELKEKDMPSGMDMQLTLVQSTALYEYPNDELDRFFDRLISTSLIQSCRTSEKLSEIDSEYYTNALCNWRNKGNLLVNFCKYLSHHKKFYLSAACICAILVLLAGFITFEYEQYKPVIRASDGKLENF